MPACDAQTGTLDILELETQKAYSHQWADNRTFHILPHPTCRLRVHDADRTWGLTARCRQVEVPGRLLFVGNNKPPDGDAASWSFLASSWKPDRIRSTDLPGNNGSAKINGVKQKHQTLWSMIELLLLPTNPRQPCQTLKSLSVQRMERGIFNLLSANSLASRGMSCVPLRCSTFNHTHRRNPPPDDPRITELQAKTCALQQQVGQTRPPPGVKQ